MAYIFVTDNQTPVMTTSNPVTLTTTVGPATVAVAHIYGKDTARSGTAPTYDGVTMTLSSSGSFMSTAGDWTRQETFYLMNADVGTGSNIVLSVPNTTNESLYVDISFFYSEIDAVHNFDGSNSGEDLGPSTITNHYPSADTNDGVLFVDGIMERGGIYVTSSNTPGELIYFDETDDSKFLSQYFWNQSGNTNQRTRYTFTDEPSSFVGSLIVFNHHPTHVLNTANNINFGANSTPELYFTGSDQNGDVLHYEIQIDNTQPPFWATPSIYYTSSSEELPAINPYAFAGTPSYSPYFFNTEIGQTTEVPPFTQGSTIKYSIQPPDALPDGIWYWRISTWNGVGWSSWWAGEQAIYRGFEIESGATNSPPTITLNTPDGFNFGTDTTPTLEFTGYDVNGDDLTYEIEIDNVSNFIAPDISKSSDTPFVAGFLNTTNGGDTDPFTVGETVSYTVQGGDALADGTWYWRARSNDGASFSNWSNIKESRTFIIESATNSTPTIVMNTADETDFGTNSTPLLEFTGSDTDGDDLTYEIKIDNTFTLDSGNLLYYKSEFSPGSTPSYSAGFNNTENFDSDPFNESDRISYTVQGGDALADGTWYWSVRAYDSMVWSNWGNTFEFYINGKENIRPTIILNTPNGTDFGGDTTPSLVFTGSDLDGDLLSYDIMFDKVSTFDGPDLITASSSVDDTGFTDLIIDDPNDPWTQGHSIQYTIQLSDALSVGTWYWNARSYDGVLWSNEVKPNNFIIGTWSGSQWDSFFVEGITKLNGRESIFGQSNPPFQKINGINTTPG